MLPGLENKQTISNFMLPDIENKQTYRILCSLAFNISNPIGSPVDIMGNPLDTLVNSCAPSKISHLSHHNLGISLQTLRPNPAPLPPSLLIV